MPSEVDITDTEISELVKRSVLEADPNEGRCLLENQTGGIEFCHFIPRKIMKDMPIGNCGLEDLSQLEALEWYWNMQRGSLDLGTHHNIFCVGARFHQFFDQDRWLLIPEDSVIQKFYECLIVICGLKYATQKRFPEFPDRTLFFYKLVPVKKMELIPIMRLDSIPTNGSVASFTPHLYPYNTFPMVESHLHPHFVIFEAGRKLSLLGRTSIEALIADFPWIPSSIMTLYDAWTRRVPKDEIEEEDPSFSAPNISPDEDSGNDEDLNDSDDDDRTTWQTPPRRRRVSPTPTPKGKRKRKRPNPPSPESTTHGLSKVAKTRHDRQFGKTAWTDDHIHQWSHEYHR